jgi:hypothetical protein
MFTAITGEGTVHITRLGLTIRTSQNFHAVMRTRFSKVATLYDDSQLNLGILQ